MTDWEDILKAAHNDPIDPAHYTAVRARVLAEIERRHNPWQRLAWLSGAAALFTALVLILPAYRPELPPLPLPRVAVGTAADLVGGRKPQAPRMAVAKRPRPKHEPLTIKLQTSDPNIVIYWIAD